TDAVRLRRARHARRDLRRDVRRVSRAPLRTAPDAPQDACRRLVREQVGQGLLRLLRRIARGAPGARMIVDRLRPLPHRGPVTAAGAVPLAVAVVVIELRMTQWSLGARFLVAAVAAALLLAVGWLAPLEQD